VLATLPDAGQSPWPNGNGIRTPDRRRVKLFLSQAWAQLTKLRDAGVAGVEGPDQFIHDRCLAFAELNSEL